MSRIKPKKSIKLDKDQQQHYPLIKAQKYSKSSTKLNSNDLTIMNFLDNKITSEFKKNKAEKNRRSTVFRSKDFLNQINTNDQMSFEKLRKTPNITYSEVFKICEDMFKEKTESKQTFDQISLQNKVGLHRSKLSHPDFKAVPALQEKKKRLKLNKS